MLYALFKSREKVVFNHSKYGLIEREPMSQLANGLIERKPMNQLANIVVEASVG